MASSLDDLVSMAMFARVVEAKSFTAAAASLGVSKSVVSKRVSALEQQLGARLLQRSTRRLSMTPEGARLHERCATLLRAADELPALVRGDDGQLRGTLRLSCPNTFSDLFLGEILASFVRRHPQLRVELSVTNTLVDLVSERVDVAIRVARQLRTSSLIARRLARARRVVCAAPAYLAEHGTPRHPDDLRAHACLRFSAVPDHVDWRFQDGKSELLPPVSGPLASDSMEALRRAALDGAGIVILPIYCAKQDLDRGRLRPLLEDYALAPLGVYAVYAKGKLVPAKVRKLVEHLAAALHPPPWDD